MPTLTDEKRDFIVALLNALRKLPITVQILKEVKIGKNIQLLRKYFEKDKSTPIGTKALLIVQKWRTMVSDYKLAKQPSEQIKQEQ